MFGSLAITGSRIDAFDFRLSTGELSANAIFDSATSPPGRYLLEVGRRTVQAAPGCDAVVLSNPILPFSAATLADLVLAGGTVPVPAVICDQGGFPVAYALPRALFECDRDRFLNLLSATKRMVDGRLLEQLTGLTVVRPKVALRAIDPLPLSSPQGFIFRDNPKAWATQCLKALELMERRPDDWASLPLAAHHPNHAGDVMFFSLATRLNQRLDYGRQVVCAAYLDVFLDCGNLLDPVVLDMAPVSRDGTLSDAGYFLDSLDRLDPRVWDESFVVYTRFSKSYPVTPFNLIDHARFTLGESIAAFEDTLYGRAPVMATRSRRPVAPLRVLLQLNGGWPLKTYPEKDRHVLVRALVELGCEVSVLDLDDMAADGAQVVKAGSPASLRALLDDHHVFVSVDSFPLHYASQIVGHPTVALFGVTAPSNSDAPRGAGYRLPLPLMPCGGCGSYRLCPLTLQTYCGNYPRPDQVVAAVFELAAEIYGAQPVEQVA